MIDASDKSLVSLQKLHASNSVITNMECINPDLLDLSLSDCGMQGSTFSVHSVRSRDIIRGVSSSSGSVSGWYDRAAMVPDMGMRFWEILPTLRKLERFTLAGTLPGTPTDWSKALQTMTGLHSLGLVVFPRHVGAGELELHSRDSLNALVDTLGRHLILVESLQLRFWTPVTLSKDGWPALTSAAVSSGTQFASSYDRKVTHLKLSAYKETVRFHPRSRPTTPLPTAIPASVTDLHTSLQEVEAAFGNCSITHLNITANMLLQKTETFHGKIQAQVGAEASGRLFPGLLSVSCVPRVGSDGVHIVAGSYEERYAQYDAMADLLLVMAGSGDACTIQRATFFPRLTGENNECRAVDAFTRMRALTSLTLVNTAFTKKQFQMLMELPQLRIIELIHSFGLASYQPPTGAITREDGSVVHVLKRDDKVLGHDKINWL